MKPSDPVIKTILEGIEQNLKGSSELLPTFFLISEAGISVVGTPFDDASRSKDAAASVVKRMAEAGKAHTIIFLTETWQLSGDAEVVDEYMRNKDKYPNGVSDHPDSFEAVILTIETATSSQIGTAKILPGRKLAEFSWSGIDTNAKGRFCNLLGEKPDLQ